MAEEAIGPEVAAASGGGMMKKLVYVGIAVVLLAAGVVGGMVFFGGDEPLEGEQSATEERASGGPALYTSLHPPLVVNFKDSAGQSHFMQMTMEVMARDQNVINSVREHTAVIRNSLILLYSGVVYEEITTRDGKETMLADGLAEIQTIMSKEIGEPGVEAVYFTSLVIQ